MIESFEYYINKHDVSFQSFELFNLNDDYVIHLCIFIVAIICIFVICLLNNFYKTNDSQLNE